MPELRIQHILILVQLLSKGARHNFIQITTTSLGKNIKKSQQATSNYLLELENNGLIERLMKGRKVSIRITQKGYSEILNLQSILNSNLNTLHSDVELKGKVISGMVQQFDQLDGIKIDSFSDGKRTYGWVKCFHAKLNNSINCELIRLERTHYDNSIIELISKKNIRKAAKLKLSSKVSIKITKTN